MKIDTTKDLYPIIDICGIVEIVEDYWSLFYSDHFNNLEI